MISRTPSSRGRQGTRGADGLGTSGRPAIPARLWEALVVAVIGGLLTSIGSLLPVSSPATPAGFSSGPLLVILGLLPVAVALGFALFSRPLAAGGALIAAAIFTPGRLLADVQFLVDPKLAERPELLLSNATSGTLHAGLGLWLLLAGQVVTLIAGALMMGQGPQRAGDADQPLSRGMLAVAVCVGIAGATGLLYAPFRSTTPWMIDPDLLNGPVWPLVGGLLVAIAVPVVCTVAVTTGDTELTAGWLFGGAATVVAVAVPPLVAGLAVPGLHETAGPYIALIAVLGMLVLAVVTLGIGDRSRPVVAAEPELPGAARLHLAMAVLGLVAAIAALVGSVTHTFVLPAGITEPPGYAERALLPTAVIVGVLSLAMLLLRQWASLLRPALAVSLAAVFLAGAEALDAAFGGTGIDGVTLGPAAWFTGLALLAAAASAVCAGLAGGVERDDVDLTSVHTSSTVLVPSVLGALLAIGAFVLPVVRANGYDEAGIVTNFQVTSWGLLVALVTVIIVGLVAPRSRPARAVGMLLGAAAVLLVRVLEFPLTSGRIAHSSVGLGAWFALASLIVLVIAAVAAAIVAAQEPADLVGRARTAARR